MIRYTFVLSAVLLLAHPSAADIYKYRDAQGVVRYTYDLAEVPEDQRPGVKTFEEETSTPVEAAPTLQQQDVGFEDTAEKESGEEPPFEVDQKKIEELNQEKKELEEEFAALMEEKYRLLQEKERLDSLPGGDAEAAAEYDKEAKALNKKIADYQKRQEAYQKEVEAVNKALETSENPDS